MAIVYNTTNITNANTTLQMFEAVNAMSGGLFIGLLLLGLFLVVFFSLKHHNTKVVFIADSAFISIIAILVWSMGWIGMHIIIFPILLFFGSILVYFLTTGIG